MEGCNILSTKTSRCSAARAFFRAKESSQTATSFLLFAHATAKAFPSSASCDVFAFAWTRYWTTGRWPNHAATVNGVSFLESAKSGCALASTRASTTSRWPSWAAKCKPTHPSLLLTSTLALPSAMSHFTVARCPHSAATSTGVDPSALSVRLTSAWHSPTSSFTTSRCPWDDATYTGVKPSLSGASTRALPSVTSHRTTSSRFH
mmetsp:Transcript_8266/g.16043  ORF Transcript_8266/g.16043 Transcript_8266/m.16043 type:complete len:205 (+) Transcript_8266:376-990(+)